MNGKQKLFAFKLAEKNQKTGDSGKWKARDGISVAGCTDSWPGQGLFRYPTQWGSDNGVWC